MRWKPLLAFMRQNTRHFPCLAFCLKGVSALVIIFNLNACSGFVAVEDKFGTSAQSRNVHVVQKSETLFSLAWRYGWDYKALARANAIGAPYLIYPGQKLTVAHPSRFASGSPASASKTLTTTPKAAPKHRASAYKNPKSTPVAGQQRGKVAWSWPAKGKLIARFSAKSPANKGIDIGGSLGESVTAAAAGSVVYAGSGLLGYGNLVIIKHNEQFLSAYAHNKRLLVKESQRVKAGQSIAEIGSSGTDKVKLHFEIRHQGKPVNPMLYLPKVKK